MEYLTFCQQTVFFPFKNMSFSANKEDDRRTCNTLTFWEENDNNSNSLKAFVPLFLTATSITTIWHWGQGDKHVVVCVHMKLFVCIYKPRGLANTSQTLLNYTVWEVSISSPAYYLFCSGPIGKRGASTSLHLSPLHSHHLPVLFSPHSLRIKPP